MPLLGFGLLAGGSVLLGLLPTSMPNFFVSTVVLGLGAGSVVGGALRFIVLNEVAADERAAAQGLVNIGISMGNLLVVATLGRSPIAGVAKRRATPQPSLWPPRWRSRCSPSPSG